MTIAPIPEGYPRVSPYLIVGDAHASLQFMVAAFDGEVVRQHLRPDGDVMHAEVRIGDALIMVGGANPEWPAVPAALHIYVPDVDATYPRALAAGARSVSPPETKPYGDRSAYVTDASGTMWFISTRVADGGEA